MTNQSINIPRAVVERAVQAWKLHATHHENGCTYMNGPLAELDAALAAQQEPPATGETKTYSDGTLVTGTQPLPRYSPREMHILYLALKVAQKAWDGNCECAEIEGLAWNLRNGLRDLFKDAGIPLDKEPPTAVPDGREWEHAKFVQRVLEAGHSATDKDRADAYWMVREFRSQVWDKTQASPSPAPAVQDAAKPGTQGEGLSDDAAQDMALKAGGDDFAFRHKDGEGSTLKYCFRLVELKRLIHIAQAAIRSAPTQAQPLSAVQDAAKPETQAMPESPWIRCGCGSAWPCARHPDKNDTKPETQGAREELVERLIASADWLEYGARTNGVDLPSGPDLRQAAALLSTVPTQAQPLTLDAMTDDQRLEIFSKYCTSCGSKDPRCQCWNDE